MKAWIGVILGVFASACGGDEKPPPKQVDPVASATVSATANAAVPDAGAAVTAAVDAAPPPPPPPKGKINSFTRAKTSGAVDKIGLKDGNFKPDGVKDTVFELDYEGAATAIFVMTTDKEGTLTSEFDADTMTGEQTIPKEIAGVLNQGHHTAGLGVYENDKLVNDKAGGIVPALADGKHKLTLYVSAKDFPKTPVRAFVLNAEGGLVKSELLK